MRKVKQSYSCSQAILDVSRDGSNPMPAASVTKPKTTSLGVGTQTSQSLYASTQSRFATSQLIKNLGSGNNGVHFFFSNGLRTAHGRD